MQCNTSNLNILRETHLQVYPNPIPVEHGKAAFELTTTYLEPHSLKKLDSITYELSYRFEGLHKTIGAKKIVIPANIKTLDSLKDVTTFELCNFTPLGYTPLYIRINLFKNGKRRNMQAIKISHFESFEEEALGLMKIE